MVVLVYIIESSNFKYDINHEHNKEVILYYKQYLL